ncbi:GDP-mannose 4,6-dehydratase, partial [Campylobacter concisus]|uniref:GDP-mannose 4,6-dehydratase n=1 Tax=Campylobacter concisus TaxID=199 RepID=UPI00112FB46B
MQILVTSRAGYIGSHVVKALLKQSIDEITLIDIRCKGTLKALETLQKIEYFKFINANLEDDLREIFANGKFDAIFHFAAFIEVFESMSEPLKYYLNNTANVARVLRNAKTNNVNKFIFSSTDAVYGEPDLAEASETMLTNPINTYGRSKLINKQIIK